MPKKNNLNPKSVKNKTANQRKEPKIKAVPEPKKEKKSNESAKFKYALLRGMHDVLPREQKYWQPMLAQAQRLAEDFQFKKIDTPIMEEVSLFIRSIGKGTDIIDKEMYIFEDKEKYSSKICLRPEMTASVVRAYIQHGLWNQPQPVKLWYSGPMFRHDRPQAGRFRQFNQIGFETLGDGDPATDAELILIAYNFFHELGLPVEIHINSIGNLEEREKYIVALVEYYRAKRSYLCDDCRKRINKNPLRLLDCKQSQCRPIKEESPQIIDWLSTESRSHFMKVLEYLDELEIPYTLRHSLVRGLDYYSRTVFEIYPTADLGDQAPDSGVQLSKQDALGGGGRYDLLAEQMGGRPTMAGGFSLGLERAAFYYKACCEKEITKLPKREIHAFLAQLGDQAKRRSLKIINQLRASGLVIDFNLTKNSLKGQLDIANSLHVPYALILGQKEVQDSTIIIRDMESGVQEIVDQKKLSTVMLKKVQINVDQTKKK
ncbi:MAG: histidine--tRNA ligase [Candidatus Magasanikbacteria bacterium CG10_big_fil_rev_8_21_14_0_10_40_10]|uniref:Histidine--tRNA ligase n=1 Tax=Candidatus Magasanikbacteria bacterium CG10_big_fil_rev_8_21_14_0_10_40_10 TaxID=1974648 RepID=A0A2M6W3G4_9BACT|nr:MAG: histidine--tRNA ligase [Candidatus Magasanikbacteria bacterium CG10_big_fil_rev_8_21_14_0_10_40_10]